MRCACVFTQRLGLVVLLARYRTTSTTSLRECLPLNSAFAVASLPLPPTQTQTHARPRIVVAPNIARTHATVPLDATATKIMHNAMGLVVKLVRVYRCGLDRVRMFIGAGLCKVSVQGMDMDRTRCRVRLVFLRLLCLCAHG